MPEELAPTVTGPSVPAAKEMPAIGAVETNGSSTSLPSQISAPSVDDVSSSLSEQEGKIKYAAKGETWEHDSAIDGMSFT